MPDNSRRPPSDPNAVDDSGVAGYLLDEALPDVAASRIAAELGAAMASRASRRRRTLVAGTLLTTAAAAAAVIVSMWPARPRPEATPAPTTTEPPRTVASVPLPQPAPRPVPDRKRPESRPGEVARGAHGPAAPPALESPARNTQPKETSPLTARSPAAESAIPAPSAPLIVTGPVVPADAAENVERAMTLFAVRTDRPRGRPMFLYIRYRPSQPGPVKETP